MVDVARTHVLLPSELLAAIDRRVGQRRRSQFLTEAAREKLERDDAARRFAERVAAFRNAAGSLAGRTIPEWATQESADAWVREQRRGRDERIDQRWRES